MNGTCTGETLHFDVSALLRTGKLENVAIENGNIVLKPTPDIRGIYALKQSFTDREKDALQMDWIDGMSIRATSKDIEPEKDVYDWALFDEAVKYVRDLNEKGGTAKTVQLRIMDGIWSPLWLKAIGVQYISYVRGNKKKIGGTTTMSHPVPIDNPVLFERLRLLYRTAALRLP